MVETRRPPHPEIGRILRAAREDANMGRAELERRSGISKSMIVKIERGQRSIGTQALSRLTHVLGPEFRDRVMKVAGEAHG